MRMARSLVPRRLGLAPWRAPSSAHALLHERADSSLFGGGQLLQREGGRPQGWRAGFDDSMEPLAHGAIRFRHRGELREHGAFPVRLVRLQLLGALLHRDSLLVRESLDLLVDRAGALGGLPRGLLWNHGASLY